MTSERFVDQAPAEVHAALLDEGHYHCSVRTMYRILAQSTGVRERRDQLRHPHHAKPVLCATRPNQVWSWDITKLLGPAKWSYFYLYVMARDVRVMSSAFKADLPSAAPSVLMLVQARATWSVLMQHVTTLALDAGLTTEAGQRYLELAMKLDQRAERLAITSLDIATSLFETEPHRGPSETRFPWLEPVPDEPSPANESAPASQPGASEP